MIRRFLACAWLTCIASDALADYPLSATPVSRLEEQRYCGEPERYANQVIKRSAAVRAAFIAAHPCPVTGLQYGTCPGWSVDHVIPLACGGCDAVANMQWLPNAIKSCALSTGLPCKDRFERLIYCRPMRTVK